jgi:hypothetical protein
MTHAEACQVLGLEAGAPDGDTRAAFKRLAHDLEGNQPKYEEILAAGRVLGIVGQEEPGTALALRSSDELVTRRRQSLALETIASEARMLKGNEAAGQIEKVARVRIDPLRRARRRAAWLAGVTGIIGATSLLLRGIGAFYGSGSTGATDIVVLSSVAVGLGALAGVFTAINSLHIQNLQAAFDDLTASLSRRATVAAALREILGPSIGSPDSPAVRESDLEDAVMAWLQSARPVRPKLRGSNANEVPIKLLANRIGAFAFTGVLVAKATEAEIFGEQEALDDDGTLQVSYTIAIAPRTNTAEQHSN